ncbi:unnamed protein product [Cylindrotheca closterium]|uniref:Uncharacterized protein n=1 Tax=Cylindrotheca closterium TaxID=2856 RepID=A0AAD2FIG2_9STRA|nr:unnamed protein product [Cylindrotheca closterium]
MRSKSRPRNNDDIEQSTSSGDHHHHHHHHHSEVDSQAEVQAKKRKRMKQAAAMLAILVAAIIAATLLLLGNNNADSDDFVVGIDNDANAVNTAPSLAPAMSPNNSNNNGKNDNDEPSSSFIPTIGNHNSPTLAPSLLPTVTTSAPSITTTLPFPNPTMIPTTLKPSATPSFKPTTQKPSVTPSFKPTFNPTTTPTLDPTTTPTHNPTIQSTTLQPSTEPSVNDNIFLDNFDEVVSLTDNFQILQVVDHDPSAFTQGLYYDKDSGLLTEGTGIYGRSLIRTWDPMTGQVLQETKLERAFFGEGVTWYMDSFGEERFIQITWKEQSAFVYDTTDLNQLQSFTYDQRTTTNEGWGITFDPIEQIFYVSDGSHFIHIWDLNFQLVRKFPVTWKQENGDTRNVDRLNELEWDPITKTILANVWYANYIVRIWPGTGKVIQVHDMASLQSGGGGGVLNGIAHHSAKKWWVTGKEWRNLYLIEFNESG